MWEQFRLRERWQGIAAVSVGTGVCFSVLLISVAFGVEQEISRRLDTPALQQYPVLNIQSIKDILHLLVIVVASAMILQTAIATFTIGSTVMRQRREEIAIRRQSGAYRSTILREFLAAMLAACIAGGIVGEAAGFLISLSLRTWTVLPVTFNAISVASSFPTTVGIALLATLLPAWRSVNGSPALLRRSGS